MNRRYDAVFFDMGYTLVWFFPTVEEIARRAWHEAGLDVSMEQLQDAYARVWEAYEKDFATARFPASQEYDRQTWWEQQRQLMHLLGSDDEEMLKRYVASLMAQYQAPGALRLYDDVLPALSRLKSSGYRLGIISNWSWNLLDRCRQVGIEGYFDVIMGSAYAGCNKPHPDIFRQALERVGAPAGRAVHVGDKYETDVVGARAAGMDAVLLDRKAEVEDPDCPVVHDLGALLNWMKGRGRD